MGSMTLILSSTDTATDLAKALDSKSSGASKTAKFLVHVKAITGDWTAVARIRLGTSNNDVLVNVPNMTATGIFTASGAVGYNTLGQAIPKPSIIALTENSAGSITADYYWLAGD